MSSDVNKDWTCKDKDKDQIYKDQDKDKDLNMVVKEINPNFRDRCNIGYDYNFFCAESWPRTYT